MTHDPTRAMRQKRMWLLAVPPDNADTGRHGDHRAWLAWYAHRSVQGAGVLLRTRSRAQAGAHRTGFLGLRAPRWPPRRGLLQRLPQQGHFSTGPVVGFAVRDLPAAVDELRRAGIELLGEPGPTWWHFRGPMATYTSSSPTNGSLKRSTLCASRHSYRHHNRSYAFEGYN